MVRKILSLLLILVVVMAVGCSSKQEENNNIPGQAFVSGDFYPIATALNLAEYFQEMDYSFSIDYVDRIEDRSGNFIYLGEEQGATGLSLEFPQLDQVWHYWLDDDGNFVDILLNEQAVEADEEAETMYNDFVLPFITGEQWIPPLTDIDRFAADGWTAENKRTVIRNLGWGNINVDAFWCSDDSGNEYYFEVVKCGDFNIYVNYEVTEDDITYSFQLKRLVLH